MASNSGKVLVIYLMGISACGKSTVGLTLSKSISLPFLDADSLHSEESINKMSSGHPLTDSDRLPWLQRVRVAAIEQARSHSERFDDNLVGKANHHQSHSHNTTKEGEKRVGIIVACSALKLSYRNLLRGDESEGVESIFIYLRGTRQLLLNRLQHRAGHFMKENLLDSQFDTLEVPEEAGTSSVDLGDDEDVERGLVAVVRDVETQLAKLTTQ